MKKKWMVPAILLVFFLSFLAVIYIEKPTIQQNLADTIKTTANSRLNGTLAFDDMDISLSGKVTFANPVIKDVQGTTVLTGDTVSVQINPWKLLDILKGDNAMAALDTIDVEHPLFYAVQKQDGTWNAATLMKQNTESTDAGYRGNVRFHDGRVSIAFNDGMKLIGEDCNGSLDFSNYPVMAADVDLTVDHKKISASGHYQSTRDYDMTVRGDAVDIMYAMPFMPDNVDVVLQDGTVKNIRLHLSQDHKGFFLSGQADVHDGAAVVNGYNITDVNGHVDMTSDELVLKKAEASINGQQIQADGTIKVNGDTPVFDLQIQAPAVDIGAFSLGIPVTGIVGWKGTVWGTAADPSVQGKLTVSSLSYNGIDVSNGGADITYQNHVAEIDNLDVDVAGGHVSGNGVYNSDSGEFSSNVQADSIGLENIPQVPANLIGTVSAKAAVYGNSHDSKTIQGQAHVDALGISYNGIEADKASCDLIYSGGIATVSNLTASVAGGKIQASGTFDTTTNRPDITFTAVNLPMDMLSAWLSVPVEGTLSAAGHVWGDEPQWNIAFSAKSGSIKNMPFDSIDGSLHGSGRQINIPAAHWRFVDGTHTISGSANLDSRIVNLRVDTEHMRLERLLPALGRENMAFTGWADNTVVVSGTLDNPEATGHFRLSEGAYNGYLYKNISSDYELRNGVLYIRNGNISAYDASISIYGSIGNTLDLNVEGNQLDISRIMMTQKSLDRSGMMTLKAHIGGTVQNPTANGSLKSDRLIVNHMPLTDVHGDFAYYDGIIRLSDLHFNQTDGAYDGNIMYNTRNDAIISHSSVHNGDLASLLSLLGVPLQKVEGRFDGDISVNGTGKNPKAAFKGNLTKAYLDGHAVDPTDIDVQFEDGVFKINKLSLTTGDTVLAAQGSYALHGPVDMQVAARNFPSRVLLDVFGKSDINVDTSIDFAAQLSGNGDNPDANVSAQLNGGTINGVSISNVYALFNVRDDIIDLNQVYISKAPYKASATGTIPVSALKGGRTAESMDVTVKLDHAGLDILTFLTPMVKSAQGGIEGAIKLSGTLENPYLNGTLAVQDGTIQFRDITYPLSHITGTMDFKGTALAANISGQMDKKGAKKPGNITIQGKAGWQGRNLTTYEAVVDADRLYVDCDYFTGPLTSHIELTPGRTYPKLSGVVEIANTTIDVPIAFTSSTSSMPLELDLTVSLGDKVRLYNSALYDMLINGSVNFKGTIDNPRPSGRFEASRGTIHYLDTNFMLSKAKADFSLKNSFLPTIDVEGRSRVGQYTVLLTLRGPADNMDMMLRSDPPLTKQQIISLITLRGGGKQDSSINSQDVNTLIGTGIRMTLNSLGITHELEKALSLDMLTVTTGSLDFNNKNTDVGRNYYNIEMGKYLFNDFMVTAAFGLNHGDNRFGVQYSLGDRFNVNAWKSEKSTFIGGSYRYNFF